MRICLLSPYNPKGPTGIGVFVEELARGMEDRGNHVLVVTAENEGPAIRASNGFALQELRLSRQNRLRNVSLTVRTLVALLKGRHDFDVIHGQQPHIQTSLAAILGRLMGKPTVTTLHLKRQHFSSRLERAMEKISEWITGRCSTELVFVSEHTRRSFAADDHPVIYNGVNTDRFHPVGEGGEVRPEKSPLRIVFVGRLTKTKGILDLMDALGIVQRSHGSTSFRLTAVGEMASEEKGEILERIRKLGIEDVFRYEGVLGNISEKLRESQLFILPSYYEGFPISLLEAMASGLPVIASRVGGVPEVVVDDENGFLCDPRRPDQLARLISRFIERPSELDRLGNNARQRVVKSFSTERMLASYEEVYRSLLSKRASREVS